MTLHLPRTPRLKRYKKYFCLLQKSFGQKGQRQVFWLSGHYDWYAFPHLDSNAVAMITHHSLITAAGAAPE
jgi:hypothetical protein